MTTWKKEMKHNSNKDVLPLKIRFWLRVIFFFFPLTGSALVDLAWSLVFHSLCRRMSRFEGQLRVCDIPRVAPTYPQAPQWILRPSGSPSRWDAPDLTQLPDAGLVVILSIPLSRGFRLPAHTWGVSVGPRRRATGTVSSQRRTRLHRKRTGFQKAERREAGTPPARWEQRARGELRAVRSAEGCCWRWGGWGTAGGRRGKSEEERTAGWGCSHPGNSHPTRGEGRQKGCGMKELFPGRRRHQRPAPDPAEPLTLTQNFRVQWGSVMSLI